MKKRILITLLLIALLCSLAPLSVSLAENYATVYSGNKYGVRMRSGPATTYDSTITLPSGTSIVILEQGAVWTRIQAGTNIGYMMSRYLIAAGTDASLVSKGTATVTSGNGLKVWLRSSKSGKRLGLYSVGTPVSILTYGDEWCQVRIGSSIGYMMTQFLKMPEQPTPTPTPTFAPLTAVSANYPYPVVGDRLTPVTVPQQATATFTWTRVDSKGNLTALGTGASYMVTSSDNGCQIRITATGTGEYSGATVTYDTAAVTNERKITGVSIVNANKDHSVPVVGDVLNAAIIPSSATVTYSWRVAGVEKATTASYTVTAADKEKSVQVFVTATDQFTGSASSLATGKVVSGNDIISVKLSSTMPVVGNTLSAVITPVVASADYVWYVDGIKMGTNPTYLVTAFDMGKTITVTVTGKDGYSGVASSEASSPVAKTLLTNFSITFNNVAIGSTVPVVGDTLGIAIGPAYCTADIQWFQEGNATAVGNGAAYTVKSSDKNLRLYAVATGTGAYGGSITTARTAVVSDASPLTSVALNITSPVVGDIVTAVVTPDRQAASNTYIWFVNNESSVGGQSYKVVASDIGKQIRVQVNGGGANAGTVVSDPTNAVVAAMKLTGISIYNESAAGALGSNAPLSGQTLRADVSPWQAESGTQVSYAWVRNKDGVVVSNTRSYTVTTADKGSALTVTASGNGIYTEKVSVTTAAVANTQQISITMPNTLTPVAGKSPLTSFSGQVYDAAGAAIKDQYYTASVSWLGQLDQYGHFMKDTAYRADVSFSMNGAYSLLDSTTTVTFTDTTGSAKALRVASATFGYCDFTAIGGTEPVSSYYISGVQIPAVGELVKTGYAVTANSQFSGTVTSVSPTDTNYVIGQTYTATIELTALTGYTFDTLQGRTSLFTVAGAKSTTFTVNADPTKATVTAVFDAASADAKISISASRITVPVGTSAKSVVLNATLSNYVGKQSDLPWTWSINGQSGVNTAITWDADSPNEGVLVIDRNEPVGNISVTAAISGSTYSNTILITLVSSDAATGTVEVEFIKAPTSVKQPAASTAVSTTFVAYAKNTSNEMVYWDLSGNTSKSTMIKDGVLTVAADETASKLTITATSIADTTKSATCSIVVDYFKTETPVSISFVESAGTLAPGGEGTFKATLANGKSGETIKFVLGSGATVSKTSTSGNDYSCNIKVNDDAAEGSLIAVTAVYSGNSDIYQTKFITVLPSSRSKITMTGLKSVPTGRTAMYAAAVQSRSVSSAVTWSLSGNKDSGTTIDENGLLTVALSETADTLLVSATSAEDASLTAEMSVTVEALTVEFTQNIAPAESTLKTGDSQTFTAAVSDGAINWSLNGAADSTIDANGLLTIGANETAESIEVVATAALDSAKTQKATVTVKKPVTVTISPEAETVNAGGSVTFTAAASSGSVKLTVSGGNGSSSMADNVLTVGLTEEHQTVLTVTAVSDEDSSATATAQITVNVPVVLFLDAAASTAEPNSSVNINATTNRGGVTWEVTGGTASAMNNGALSIGAEADGTELTVTAISTEDASVKNSVTVTVKEPVKEPVTIQIAAPETAPTNSQVSIIAATNRGGVALEVTGGTVSSMDGSTLNVGAEAHDTQLTVTAVSTEDNTVTASTTIIVKEPVTIQLDTASAQMVAGQSKQFSAALNHGDQVNWSLAGTDGNSSLSDTGNLVIGEKETATSLTVTATSVEDETKSAQCAVTIVKPATKTNTMKIAVDTVKAVSAKLKKDGMTWQSSHPEIAKVDETGTVTGVTAGKATITGTLAGDSPKVVVIVVTVVAKEETIDPAEEEVVIDEEGTTGEKEEVSEEIKTPTTENSANTVVTNTSERIGMGD
ncbi:MAG: Ig-like domain-containing protein [Eubacteriales bacterium]|nr:Ig-like domain-containing protein [Eubacteriales bacterium]